MKPYLFIAGIIATPYLFGAAEHAPRSRKRKQPAASEQHLCPLSQKDLRSLKSFTLPKNEPSKRKIRLRCGHEFQFGALSERLLLNKQECPTCETPAHLPFFPRTSAVALIELCDKQAEQLAEAFVRIDTLQEELGALKKEK